MGLGKQGKLLVFSSESGWSEEKPECGIPPPKI